DAAWFAQDRVDFVRQVQPIFQANCAGCHGAEKQMSQLNVLNKASLARVVTPGKSKESRLVQRLLGLNGEARMPKGGEALSAEQLALIERWINEGADFPAAASVEAKKSRHWSLVTPQRPATPSVKNSSWVRNPIDAFILARLERENLKPSPQADARTLIRRLSLDLIGLLPQPSEVESFVKAFGENQDAAYNALVERLLASPHYGERWGRHWLDHARYADSNGYTIDGERVMWPYRDWVIQAFNEDKPFDQFTIEQLAGDLLPTPSDPRKAKAQLVATGFHRNTVINEEGGVDPEQARVEQVMDRVQTTGAVWLGLTIGCAQCHSHKFDPISNKEYYQMFAFFNSTMDVNNQGPVVSVQRGEMFGKPETAEPLAATGAPVRTELKQGEWEKQEIARLERNPAISAPKKDVEWKSFDPVKFDTEAAGKLQQLEDGSFLIASNASVNDAYRILVRIASPRVAAVRLRVMPHEALPKRGSGLAEDGSFALSEFYIDSEGGQHRFSEAFADDEQTATPARAAADGDRRTSWAINDTTKPREAVFVFAKPKDFASRQIQFILRHEAETNHGIGHFKIEVATETPHDARGAALLEALKLPAGARSLEQQRMIAAAFASARAVREKQSGNAVMAMVMHDTTVPRESYIFTRGDFTRPNKAAGLLQPDVLSAVAPTLADIGKPRTRLDLAKWLVDPANPLPSRVTMNRVWMRYFGRGIVETEEDFGTQGARPTHPELLDWLATEFIRQGWSLKAMHRLIVTSATYRQASEARKDLSDVDPRNLLLARQERFRVESEIVRDAALSASGLLNPRIGGPSVRPPQPEGVYAFTQNKKNWTAANGSERFRRALYTHFFRSAPYPLFSTFDTPDFQSVCTRRHRSNTPLQSLTLANDPAFLEIAQGLAARLVREVPGEFSATLDARLRQAFALCLSRSPNATELAALRGYVDRQTLSFADRPASTAALANKEMTTAGLTEAQAAALTAAARVLFNTDNFITRE
ncbi:MAG TPA: PSD1 and planctomycete cytochrome C domain-containing protein, partial [Blastocatellia bacterium]|nr:PSD1 and planctomycete cytochrome C domain-containing protein [Blastocatellia bacterium]